MTKLNLLSLSTGLLLSLAAVQGAPIIGGTNDPGNDIFSLSFSGPGLSFSAVGPELGPGGSRTCANTDTTPCDLTVTIPVIGGPGQSILTTYDGLTLMNNPQAGCPGGANCGTVSGQMTFSTIVLLGPVPPIPTTLPTTVSGEIKAVYDNGQQLYDLAISGSGTANLGVDFAANNFIAVSSIFNTFSGTANPTPEPGTGALLASGLLVAAGCCLVRRALARFRS
jgi:hypothetical protein